MILNDTSARFAYSAMNGPELLAERNSLRNADALLRRASPEWSGDDLVRGRATLERLAHLSDLVDVALCVCNDDAAELRRQARAKAVPA